MKIEELDKRIETYLKANHCQWDNPANLKSGIVEAYFLIGLLRGKLYELEMTAGMRLFPQTTQEN